MHDGGLHTHTIGIVPQSITYSLPWMALARGGREEGYQFSDLLGPRGTVEWDAA